MLRHKLHTKAKSPGPTFGRFSVCFVIPYSMFLISMEPSYLHNWRVSFQVFHSIGHDDDDELERINRKNKCVIKYMFFQKQLIFIF